MTAWLLPHVEREGRLIADATSAAPHEPVPTCPGWRGRDLAAHVAGYSRWLRALFAGAVAVADPVPDVDPDEALRERAADLDALVALLRDTPADAPVPNWSVRPAVAGFWLRRTAHELAVHRVDAAGLHTATPDPVPADLARDGIAEYFEAFVATAFAAGAAPPAEATMVLELTDTGAEVVQHLPDPGPRTVVRGTASELFLALWHRGDLVAHHVGGDVAMLANWPRI